MAASQNRNQGLQKIFGRKVFRRLETLQFGPFMVFDAGFVQKIKFRECTYQCIATQNTYFQYSYIKQIKLIYRSLT